MYTKAQALCDTMAGGSSSLPLQATLLQLQSAFQETVKPWSGFLFAECTGAPETSHVWSGRAYRGRFAAEKFFTGKEAALAAARTECRGVTSCSYIIQPNNVCINIQYLE